MVQKVLIFLAILWQMNQLFCSCQGKFGGTFLGTGLHSGRVKVSRLHFVHMLLVWIVCWHTLLHSQHLRDCC